MVLDLNKQDGGNRKFILVKWANIWPDITAERLKREINGCDKGGDATKAVEGLGGGFAIAALACHYSMNLAILLAV